MNEFQNDIHSLLSNSEVLEELEKYDYEKLSEFIIRRRKEYLSAEAMKQKGRIIAKGRCPICTLYIPCKHYENKLSEGNQDEEEDKGNLQPPGVFFSLQSLPVYYKNPEKEKKRLKLLKDLEIFREKKILEEVNCMKADEEKKNKELQLKKDKEIKRKKYMEIQKEKLKEYKEERIRSSAPSPINEIRIRKTRTTKPSKYKSKFDEIDTILYTQLNFIS